MNYVALDLRLKAQSRLGYGCATNGEVVQEHTGAGRRGLL